MMTKGACKNCEYWIRKQKPDHVGKCHGSKFVYVEYGNETPKDGLGYWDFDSYKAGFETGEDFGCIHFKQRT